MTLRWRSPRSFATPTSSPESTADADQAWKVLGLVNDWLRHAETKLATTLTAAGVTGGALFNLVKNHQNGSVIYSASAVVCFAGVIGAAVFAGVGLFPRLTLDALRRWLCNITNTDTVPRNPIYFNDISRAYPFGSSDYVSVLRDLTTTPDDLVRYIAQQVQANSAVAQRKYRWATWAMRLLAIDLVGLAALSTVIALKLS